MRRAVTFAVAGSTRDLDLLGDLAWAGILTTDQVARLHFPSRRRAQRRLRALLDLSLVRAHLQGEALHRENVHTLTPSGLDLLLERGRFDAASPPRLGRMPRPQKLRHSIAIREVFVALRLAERAGGLELEDFLFEEQLARAEPWRAYQLIPDALAVLSAPERATVGVEVDLGTETKGTLQQKLERWRSALTGNAATSLLFVVVGASRWRTVAGLARELDLSAHLRVIQRSDVTRALQHWPHLPAAPPIRAVRPAEPREGREMTPVLRRRERGV